MKSTIAIIGAGNLGLSIASGLHQTGHSLVLTRRKTASLSSWTTKENVEVTSDNIQAVTKADVVIIAVQPRQCDRILRQIKQSLQKNCLVVCTAAGYQIEQLEAVLGSDIAVYRAMPNTAISVQASMTLIASNETGFSRLSEVEELFSHVGETLAIEEDQMQAATVLCASGIAFWLRLIRANPQGGVQVGFESEVALKIATQTAYGAARLLIESGNHPEAEIDRVTTPSGCTITGLNVMEHSGMSSAFIQGLTASFDKINEIKSTT